MKNCYFKKLALLLALFVPLVLRAQQPPQPCNIVITGDFESQCLLPTDKDSFYVENGDMLIACQGMRVTYTASVNTGGITVTNWKWNVVGAATWNDNYNGTVTVDWGSGNVGQLTVEVSTAIGTTCTKTVKVQLIESPTVASSSTPAYIVNPDGSKTLYVCKDESVDFTDLSTTTNTDIAGYYWESTQGGSASTPNYHVESFANYDDVVHRVYNNCGCYSEEVIHIEILYGDTLDLGCYGTVCEGTTVTYTARNPSCSNYYWYVEDGTIVDGQGSQQVTVQWGAPADGYGVIGIDGDLCGQDACPGLLSKKIPIISNGLSIQGQRTACVGESVVYSLPLFGSTRYQWTVTPSFGAVATSVNGANEWMYTFSQPGSYQISVEYGCDFLECGIFESETLTVVVKPRLFITGEERICEGSACHLTTEPGVSASWKVEDIDNNYQQVYSYSGTTLTHTFNQAGRYLVTAENSSYCRPAEFILTVEAAPPAPTAADMDTNNPTVACLGSAILLKGTPSNPDYSLIWEPSCSEGSPQSVSGSEVTINYGNAVCGVDVYNYDRVLGCRSTGHYTHPVSQFQLAQHTLPTQITVCPGTLLDWTNSVPHQDNVVYEWRLENLKQNCASVQGSRFSNAIRLQVNELDPSIGYPHTFHIKLYRTYCSSLQDIHTVYITIDSVPASPSLSIVDPGDVCAGTMVQLSAQGCGNGVSQWQIQDDDHTYTGNPLNYTFLNPGNATITYMCNTYGACTNREYISQATRTVMVYPAPPFTRIGYDGTHVYVDPTPTNPLDYHYAWSHTSTNNYLVNYDPNVQIYTCTVTSQTVPYCSVTLTLNTTLTPVDPCQGLSVVYDGIDYCTKSVSFHVANPPGDVQWTVPGSDHGNPSISGNNNEYITIPVTDVGDHTVFASISGTPCYSGGAVGRVDFLPDFSFEKRCDTIVIHNNSKYLDDTKTLQLSVNGTPLLNSTVSFMDYNLYTGNGGTYVFSLTGYDGNPLSCPLDTVTIGNTGGASLTITPAHHTTCDNTPIALTLSMSADAISRVHWEFGDPSHLDTTGNRVVHTFSVYWEPTGGYPITAYVVDTNGCASMGSVHLHSGVDPLVTSTLSTTSSTETCTGTARQIRFRDSYNQVPSQNPVYYNWSTTPFVSWDDNTHNTYYTGDYSVFVQDDHYCQAEAVCNVGFKNRPDVVIVRSSPTYCVGDEIKLFGAPDPDTTNYTFNWYITEIGTSNTITSTYSKVFFTATHSTTYNVALCIINNTELCQACGSEIIQVNPTPAAPTVTFGSNACIDNPPVELVGSSAVTSDLHWSNGDVGTYANYYTPGIATSWYYHPVTGCKSATASIFIEPEPNFDALLTGCYERCKDFLTTHNSLPVWGLYAGREPIDWYWWLNTNYIDNGIQNAPNYTLQLPLVSLGDYWLDVKYNSNNCHVSSPHFVVNVADTCECEGWDISTSCSTYVNRCRLYYDVTVTICNNSSYDACVDDLFPLFDLNNYRISNSTFTGQLVAPSHCYSFTMTIEALRMVPLESILFRILDKCNGCTKDFSIDLSLGKFECHDTMRVQGFNIPLGMESDAAAYIDFLVDFSYVQNVLAFWVEPPMLFNYTYDSFSGLLRGLYMMDRGMLSRLAMEGGDVCFYAITCNNDKLCLREYCVAASVLHQLLSWRRIQPEVVSDSIFDNDSIHTKTAQPQTVDEPTLRLVPNPTAGEVQVIGAGGEVVEVLVLDMKGRQVAKFEHTDRFDISSFPSGTYIIRVRTRSSEDTEQITYLKLVKE